MPLALRLVSRVATPQISITDNPARSVCRRVAGTEFQRQTASKADICLAHLLASFARVLVPAISTQTGTPTLRRTAASSCVPAPAAPGRLLYPLNGNSGHIDFCASNQNGSSSTPEASFTMVLAAGMYSSEVFPTSETEQARSPSWATSP